MIPFKKRIITSNEKQIIYEYIVSKKEHLIQENEQAQLDPELKNFRTFFIKNLKKQVLQNNDEYIVD